MAFTTWAALYSAMLNDLADSSWRVKSYEILGVNRSFSSFKEFKDALEYIKFQTDIESGDVASRVYAKDGGRGS